MGNYQYLNKGLTIVASLFLTIVVIAQNNACPTIISDALETVENACDEMGRNQICYGNIALNATDTNGQPMAAFNAVGDVTDVDSISQLVTAPLDTNVGEWGVAVMVLQADIPDTLPGQNVTFVIFGDTTLEAEPNASDDFAAPMQAFRFSTGIGQPECADAPPDGILVQSPEDITVNFLVNGLEVSIGSTAYISSNDDNSQSITLLEGQAEIMTDDGETTVEAGFTVDIMDDQSVSEPEPFDAESAATLPISLLPRPIAIPVLLIASEATVNWIDSGISVEAGETYDIRATGRTNLWSQCSEFCQDTAEYTCTTLCTAIEGGPAGTSLVTDVVASSDPFMVMPGERFLVLLGRIGDGEMFVVGDELVFTAETSGTLYFRINEDTRVAGDEPGAYAVSILQLTDE